MKRFPGGAYAAILIVLLALSACMPKRVPAGAPVDRGFYIYVKVSDATYHVLAKDPRYLEIALKEIGCGVSHTVCVVERVGEVFIVEQQR